MQDFIKFKTAVQKQFDNIIQYNLFKTNVSKDELWDTYLESFPEGSNPMFRERTEHNCQCCRQFIRACGNVVAIIDNKLISIWDINIDGVNQIVTNEMSKLVKSKEVIDKFIHYEKNLGTDFNHQLLDESTIKWDHFYYKLPIHFIKKNDLIGDELSKSRSSKDVFKRGLVEISISAIETVLELIEQNSIYRGKENKSVIKLFLKHKKEFDQIKLDSEKDNYVWSASIKIGGASRLRNSAIGTLLVDISEGKELDASVKSYEIKVDPTNYKRPNSIITKSMVDNAQKKIIELGIESSLYRRHANINDITINNILFADRSTKKEMNVFDVMKKEAPVKVGKFNKVEEVNISTFIEDILPKADTIEIQLHNKHINNLMSLIAPVNQNVKPIFKWGNNFSWAYNGEVTDSIKERVKKAGGLVDGVLRCSLSWFNYDDLDIHIMEPNKNHISYVKKGEIQSSSGILDVDMNVESNSSRNPVENIVWTNKSKMEEGIYKLWVNQYKSREMKDMGFDIEIEYEGVIHTFHYDKKVIKDVQVAKFSFTKSKGIELIESLPTSQATKEIWGINTNQFHKVSMIMNSPNHWNGESTGNKHWFFILEDCKNDKQVRGFFNEFLNGNLTEHRKIFEVLGSKLKAEISDEQLSGLGFSSTQKNSILCKVTGNFTRIIKINF